MLVALPLVCLFENCWVSAISFDNSRHAPPDGLIGWLMEMEEPCMFMWYAFPTCGERASSPMKLGRGSGLCQVDGNSDEISNVQCGRVVRKGKASADEMRRRHLVMGWSWSDA